MQPNFETLNIVLGDAQILAGMEDAPAFAPFDERVAEYLDKVSKALMGRPEARQYPDVVTFAFWCRKSSVRTLQKAYPDLGNRLGKGVAFHIAPSNVAVNFAYSLAAGLLAGNANVVRLPSKDFGQVRLLCDALQSALDETMKQYVCLVRYGHNPEITAYLSELCDVRIIWGGDATIASIRKAPLKPRATEIAFADRYSICVIDAAEYLKSPNKPAVARGFYNDTYINDQNACTAPRLVVWTGSGIPEAQAIFWGELEKIAAKEYPLQPVQAVAKRTTLCEQAISGDGFRAVGGTGNFIVRVKTDRITQHLMDYKGNSGYFIEYEACSLDELLPLLSLPCQTLSYYGMDPNRLKDFMITRRPRGIDRIVPIGKTMDFTLVWDGYDLIRSLSREIFIS